MNMLARTEIATPSAERPRFAPEAIAAARTAAEATHRPIVSCLEDASGLAPEEFAARLAATFALPLATMPDLHCWQPAFDVLPYTESARRQCVLFRDPAGTLRLVTGDPFDATRFDWADARFEEPFAWHLAHPADVAAFLAKHEETLSA
ncbi:MAG: type II/IV secretion system protein, partial [Burkholderiales bacterium]